MGVGAGARKSKVIPIRKIGARCLIASSCLHFHFFLRKSFLAPVEVSLFNEFQIKKSFFSLSPRFDGKHWVLIELFALSTAEAEIDDEGIERDSEEIDDEKFVNTKELDHVLEVSFACELLLLTYD
jgi:hypothetical protein